VREADGGAAGQRHAHAVTQYHTLVINVAVD
jgi:hypothetical protein